MRISALVGLVTLQAALGSGLALLFIIQSTQTPTLLVFFILLGAILLLPPIIWRLNRRAARLPHVQDLEGEFERRSRAVESAMDGIAILDQRERYTFVNQAHASVYGYPPAELVGQTWQQLYAPAERERFERDYMPRLRRDGQVRIQSTGLRKDGSSFPQELSLSALSDGGLICVVRDISELRRTEEQLIQSQKMEAVGQLAGGVAHDFNNLITSILGYTLFLKNEHVRDPSVVKAAEMIERIANMAAQLTQKLLTFARRTKSQSIPINLCAAVHDAIAIFSRLLPPQVKLCSNLPSTEIWLRGDPLQLQQVILNLALNARDAMNAESSSRGGTLTIGARQEHISEAIVSPSLTASEKLVPGDYAVLRVKDTGCGMTPEVQSKIFEPFFTTKEVGKGTGMGLPVVYGIVNSHNGAITIESEVGSGTTFKVYFPLIDAVEVTKTEGPKDPLVQQPTEREFARFEGSVSTIEH